MATIKYSNEGPKLINGADEMRKRLDLVQLKTDVLENRQNGIIENVNSLRDSHKNLMDAVRAMGDLVKMQQKEIQRLKKTVIILAIGITPIVLALAAGVI